jgi:hypothetical protein
MPGGPDTGWLAGDSFVIEEQNLQSKTMIAAPGTGRRLTPAPESRLTCGDPSSLSESVGAEILLNASEVTIGRGDDSDFVLKADGVSRKHARVFPHERCWYIEDSDSTNGTRVNGKAVDRVMLNEGDTVEIGPLVYTFSIDAQPQESSEHATLEFARGIPGFDPQRDPVYAESSVGSDALLWSIVVIGASALAFAVFTIVSV